MPIKKNRIVLDSWKGQPLKGNILQVYKQLLLDTQSEIVIIGDNSRLVDSKHLNVKVVKNKSLKHMYYLATSKFWIVDTMYYDFFIPRKQTKYILIWHAAGIFKKFGISSVSDSKNLVDIYKRNGKNLSNIIVSAEKIRDTYAKELHVEIDKVIPLGLPRTDVFLKKEPCIREEIYSKYNIPINKKLILYAPTFRGEGFTHFSIELQEQVVMEKLSDEYIILLKLHTNNYIDVKESTDRFAGKLIVSEDDQLEYLMKASDILITDYSSIFFEYSLLEKPMLFYAYDLEEYSYKSRGFYMDYKSFVPGPISYSTEELIQNIKNYCMNHYIEQIKTIADTYQRHDGYCTKRFIEYLFMSNNHD
jgi:CDP-glycerol glycerophosphotransferase (TagB/SpsB family)